MIQRLVKRVALAGALTVALGSLLPAVGMAANLLSERLVAFPRHLHALRVSAPAGTRSIRVQWGGHASTTAIHPCASSNKRVIFLVAHDYVKSGAYTIPVRVTSRCTSGPYSSLATHTTARVVVPEHLSPHLVASAAALAAASTVYSYTPPSGLENATLHTVQGTPVSTGCNFAPVTGTGAPGSEIQSAEVSLDVQTCTQTYESGQPAATRTPATAGGGESASDGASAVSSTPEPAVASAATTYDAAAHTDTWYTDPVNADLAQVRVYTEWNSSSSCVTGAYNGLYEHWFSDDGWYVESKNWEEGLYCGYSYSTDYETYENDIFCAATDSFAYFQPNRIRGESNPNGGGYWYSYTDNFSSGCGVLVSWNSNVGWGTGSGDS
jgi:hypothetical protein